MHNNIMAAGSKDRPPMLGPGRYSQWRSRFLRYLDTKSNGEYLRKCIFEGPYTPTNVLIAAVEAAENILPVAAHEEAETIHNMTTENKLYFQAEKEAIFLILTGIGDEIYSTVDACNTAKEMWTAIERLQQVNTSSTDSQMHNNIMSEEDSDPNKLGGDKRMQKELGTLAKYFKKLYKPTNNNYNIFKPPGTRLKITHQRYTNDNQSGEFGNQRTDDKFWGKGNRKASGSATKWGIPCLKSCKGLDTMPGNAGSQRG
ncbi:hypothetical protein Tco_1065376 [Tanacetum coccineum]